MDLAEAPWTVDRFLAWEDRQEQKHEFDGVRVIPMTGGSRGHQKIVFNLLTALTARVDFERFDVIQEMRLRFGNRVRYPDVCVTFGAVDRTVRTLTEAVTAFEVLSEDTARIDRIDKLREYATVPGLRRYVLLDQDGIGATVHTREQDRWIVDVMTEGTIALPEIGAELPLAEIYAGLTF